MGVRRREEILQASARLFAAEGYHAVSMARIAAEVGISAVTILHYFPSKKDVLFAVAERRLAELGSWWDGMSEEPPPLEVFAYMYRSSRRLAARPDLVELGVLVNAESSVPASPAHAANMMRYRGVVEHFTSIFEGCVSRGQFAQEVVAAHVALQCLTMSDGVQLLWVVMGRSFDLAERTLDHLVAIAELAIPVAQRPLELRQALVDLANARP